MESFEKYLKQTGEVGYVEQVFPSLLYVAGLPKVRLGEVVMAETGEFGEVLSITPDYTEVLMLSDIKATVGTRMARTNEGLWVKVGSGMVGGTVNALGIPISSKGSAKEKEARRLLDVLPPNIDRRKDIDTPFETGVTIVDLAIPLGKGQRQLVIGDHKIGKTQFLMQSMLSHSRKGGICVYCGVGKRHADIAAVSSFMKEQGILKNSVLVASLSSDVTGLMYKAPYTAMSIAEFFRDKGADVLLVLDDMTIHAKYYREISLLAKRFPGRSSYPGDIFHMQARLLERAGNFTKGSITALVVAETVLGNLAGYIQTNLMSMTDGHIYFDRELYNQGKRPAINSFLSVTRVGHQTQTALMKSLSRELSSFLVADEKLRQLVHFGGELSDKVKRELKIGDQLQEFFNQRSDEVMPVNLNAVFIATVMAGIWLDEDLSQFVTRLVALRDMYEKDDRWKKYIDGMVKSFDNFDALVQKVIQDKDSLTGIK